MQGLQGTAGAQGNAAYTQMANNAQQAMSGRIGRAKQLSQQSRLGFNAMAGTGGNVIQRAGAGATPGPRLNNSPLLDQMNAPRRAMPRVTGTGENGQVLPRDVSMGGPSDYDILQAGGDPDKFRAAQARGRERFQNAQQMMRQRRAAPAQGNPAAFQVINPFMNPIAMRAMQRDPRLAFQAINDLNGALQGRAKIQSGVRTDQENRTLAQQELSLKQALGMGDQELDRERLGLDQERLEAETGYRSRLADAQIAQAQAEAERQRAEASAINDPANRQFANNMNLLDIMSQSSDPRMQQQAQGLMQSMMQGQGAPGSGAVAAAPALPNAAMAPVPTPLPDSETGSISDDGIDELVDYFRIDQGLSGDDLAAALAQQGVSRSQLMEYFQNNANGFVGNAMDGLWGFFGGEATDTEIANRQGRMRDLRGILGIPQPRPIGERILRTFGTNPSKY